jgi:biotin operon repressor
MATDTEAAYEDLMKTERVLVLALSLPIHPPPLPALNSDRAVQLDAGTETALSELECLGYAIRDRLTVEEGSTDLGRVMELHLLLQPKSWYGGRQHESQRRRLIALVLGLRDKLLGRLLVLPEFDLKPLQSGAASSAVSDSAWTSLAVQARDILGALSGKQLTGKEIARVLGVSRENISHVLSELVKLGILFNKKGSGYCIVRIPDFAPPEINGLQKRRGKGDRVRR